MVKEYPISIGGHKFVKTNLVTISGPKGLYDEYKCEVCGMKGRSYKFGTIQISASYRENIFRCKKLVPKKRIVITHCSAWGEEFVNLTRGSIHSIVDPPEGQDTSRGVWVMGVTEPVLVFFNEFEFID